MPSTVNGVGTHYYGKRDAAKRTGTCQHCGAQGQLESYTTRLWFVIIFIPIIPLKRVRIIDCCSKCSRHWVANPEQYEMSRQLAVSGAMEKHRQQPSVETALAAHAQFLGFHMHPEADSFREAALAQFKDNAELLTGFASHLEQTGRWVEATPLYEQAFVLKPTLPEVRYSLGWRRTNVNKLDEAFELYDYLRQPGAGQTFNMGPLDVLAQAYQKAGNHAKALELWAICLRELPQYGEQYSFRKQIEKSEKALDLESTLLPPRSFSLRGLFDSKSGTHAPWVRRTVFGSLAALLFVIGMMGLNEYRRTHRTMHVLNVFAQPVQVSIDGGPPVTVTQRSTIPLSEGTHQLTISGPVNKQQAIELRTGYWSRWTYSPVWIFNVERLAPIQAHTIYYAAVPRPTEPIPLKDEELSFVPHVDYVFTDPPQTMRVEGRNSVVKKVHVGQFPLSPSNLYMGMTSRTGQTDPNVAMTFAEGHLTRNPGDDSLLLLYSTRVEGDQSEQRVVEFLKAGLWRKPISIGWHRAYQHQKSIAANEAALAAEYDAQLEQDPDNPSLLYLRGRVSPTRAEQLKFFRMAEEKDPQLGWPSMALAYDDANRGQWQDAKTRCDKAEPALRSDQSFRMLVHTVKLAIGETAPLEQLYRQQLQGQDFVVMVTSAFRLTDVLAAQGKNDEARQAIRQWWSTITRTNLTAESVSPYDLMTYYVTGDTEGFLKNKDKYEPNVLPQYQAQLLLACGQPEATIKLNEAGALLKEWPELLAVSLCFNLEGKQTEADEWLSRACDDLKKNDHDARRAAALLQGDTSPTMDDLDEITLNVSETPLLLAVLARKFPEKRSELNQRAERLNISRHPPYLLIKKAIAQP